MRSFAPTIHTEIQGHIIRETDKAVQFSAVIPEDGSFSSPQWFPKSQCKQIIKAYDEIEGTFDILFTAEWILKDKKLYELALRQKTPRANKDKEFKENFPSMFSDMEDDIPF